MIHAIGDSYTWGSELDDRNQAWPYLLSAKLNMPVVNQGRPASGNWRMVKRAMDAVYSSTKLIVIGWSDPARQEFADDHGVFNVWAGRNYINTQTGHRQELVRYLTAYDVQEYYYVQWLRHILLIQSFCKANSVPCVMFIACGAEFYHKQYNTKHKNLVDQIDTDLFLGWNEYSMQTLTSHLPCGPQGHTLWEGHKLLAEKLYEHIGRIGWVS